MLPKVVKYLSHYSMPLTRSQARAERSSAVVASPRAGTPGSASASDSERPQQSSIEEGVSAVNREVGGSPAVSLAGGE